MNYGAISFSGITKAGRFDEQILAGRKRQTIREPRKDNRVHVKPGYTTKLYWKMRSKTRRYLIGIAMVEAYERIRLIEMWEDADNAKADGFQDLDEFRDWFLPEWRDPVVGRIVDILYDNEWFHQGGVSNLDDSPAMRMVVSFGRSFGKTTSVEAAEKLLSPLYRIKWRYPLEGTARPS